MADNLCPDCGQVLKILTRGGATIQKCECGYQKNITTGEVVRLNFEKPCCLVLCQNCGGKNRLFYNDGVGETFSCAFCGAQGRIPEKPDPELRSIVDCPHCGGKNRVPANRGKIEVKCYHCTKSFIYNSGTWPTVKSVPHQTNTQTKTTTQAKPKAEPKPKDTVQRNRQSKEQTKAQPRQKGTPCRTITIERATHAYKEWDIHGLKNAYFDKFPVRIVLDDVEQGRLVADEPMTLHVDSGEHTLRYNLHTPKYWIPPGNENYLVSYFHDSFRIGPENDDFRDALTMFILQMFRGQGIRDRILDDNNYGNKVYLDINPDGVRIYWTLARTKGLKQALTGEGEEKISYRQMGLQPLPEDRQPAGYWEFLKMWIEIAILQDKEADMDKKEGGFTFRTKHDLF